MSSSSTERLEAKGYLIPAEVVVYRLNPGPCLSEWRRQFHSLLFSNAVVVCRVQRVGRLAPEASLRRVWEELLVHRRQWVSATNCEYTPSWTGSLGFLGLHGCL